MKTRKKRGGGPSVTVVNEPAPEMGYQEAADLLKGLSGYEAANRSSRRSYIYFPTLDTKRELDTFSRTEMLRKARWLRANTGLANRICGGLADMIGYLTPLSGSGDEKWDDYCDRHWEERACEASVIDAAGNFDIRMMQIELNKAAFGDGDMLPVLIQASTGGIMLSCYEAHQLANPDGDKAGWFDGVKVNKFRRHLAYGIRDDDGTVKTIAAKDALYFRHPMSVGQIRPPTILKHAINNMIDIADILADVKLAIKVASQFGLYLKSQAMTPSGFGGAQAIGGALRNEQIKPGNGTKEDPKVEYKIEDIYRAQGGLANLPPGLDIGILQDERPHPNQMHLLDHLVRDIAWGVGVAPEIIWNIEKLRGANNRLVNADLNRWIACRLLRLRAWMKRFRAIWVANEIKAGRLPECPGKGEFWRATFLPQANLTADKGRDGKLNIEFIKNHLRSLSDHFAEEGKDWQTELRQIARERREMKELGLVFADLDREKSTRVDSADEDEDPGRAEDEEETKDPDSEEQP